MWRWGRKTQWHSKGSCSSAPHHPINNHPEPLLFTAPTHKHTRRDLQGHQVQCSTNKEFNCSYSWPRSNAGIDEAGKVVETGSTSSLSGLWFTLTPFSPLSAFPKQIWPVWEEPIWPWCSAPGSQAWVARAAGDGASSAPWPHSLHWGLWNGPFPGWEYIPRAECTAQPACGDGRARHLPAHSQHPGCQDKAPQEMGLGWARTPCS